MARRACYRMRRLSGVGFPTRFAATAGRAHFPDLKPMIMPSRASPALLAATMTQSPRIRPMLSENWRERCTDNLFDPERLLAGHDKVLKARPPWNVVKANGLCLQV